MSRHDIRSAVSQRLARGLRTMSLCAAMLLVAGCGSLFASRAEVPVTYVLRPSFTTIQPVPSAASPSGGSDRIVQVGRVTAAPGYATESILATLPDRRLEVFAASRWPESLPRVVENLALQALRAAGVAAHGAAAPVAPTHLLAVTVSRFDADYRDMSAAPVARVALEVTVLRRADRHVLGVFTVQSAVAAEANRMGPIVAALEAAARQALSDLPLQLGAVLTASVTGPTPGRHSPATISP